MQCNSTVPQMTASKIIIKLCQHFPETVSTKTERHNLHDGSFFFCRTLHRKKTKQTKNMNNVQDSFPEPKMTSSN